MARAQTEQPEGLVYRPELLTVEEEAALLGVRDARGVRERAADRAAVKDHDDRLLCVPFGDLRQRADDALAHRGVGLAARKRLAVVGRPAFDVAGIPPLDLAHGQAFPFPDVDLAQARIDLDAEAMRASDDRGRVARAAQVARVHGRDRLVGERCRERARLLASELIQRPVGVPLPATVAVPVGLAVPRQDQRRHAK
jgi:hypothetical protein